MSDKQYHALMPADIAGKMEMSKLLSQSGLMPKGLQTPAQVFVALQVGHELGLSPMMSMSNIAVINGRPSLSSNIMEAVVRNHKDFDGMDIEYAGDYSDKADPTRSCTVTLRRKRGDDADVVTGYFDMAMAKTAGLWPNKKDNWDNYPDRMLKARASGYASKDGYADVLSGMISYDEAEELPPLEPRDVTPEKAPDEIKKDGENTEISIDDLINMLSTEELSAIDEKLAKVKAYCEKNGEYLLQDRIDFVENQARDRCIRHFYRTGKEPIGYLEDVHNKLREQVDAARKKAKDDEAMKTTASPDPGRGATERVPKEESALMKEVLAKTTPVEDAEIVEAEPLEDTIPSDSEPPELDIF